MCKDDETDSTNYIEKGSRLDEKKKHKLRVALEYRNSAKKGKNVGSPNSTRGDIDSFDPSSITLNDKGEKSFILKTKEEDKDNPLQVILDEAKSPPDGMAKHAMLPALFADKFDVTVYYTPLETGFSQDTGRVTHILTAPGGATRSHTMSEIFFSAVVMEGWGRLANPVTIGGVSYAYVNNNKQLSTKPEDRSGRALVPRTSCAGPQDLFVIPGSEIIVKLPEPYATRFGAEYKHFTVCDVGQAFKPGKSPHIDIYWDEDNPAGLGENGRAIPASFKDVGSPEDLLQVILTKLS